MNTSIINHWIKHPELKRTEELLVLLHRMRMATSQNIADVMGLSFHTVRGDLIPSIYKKGKNILLSHRMKDMRSSYYLGTEGCRIVSKIIGEKVPFYNYTSVQARHFEGINNILGRIIKHLGIERFKTETEWYFTRQTRDMIQKEWSALLAELVNLGNLTEDEAVTKLDSLPEPDARFVNLNQKAFWLEFDNNTESKGKLKEKMLDYIETMIPMQNHDKIVWVVSAKSPKRKEYLETLWREIQNSEEVQHFRDGYAEQFFLPEMHFFVEGDETKFLLSARE